MNAAVQDKILIVEDEPHIRKFLRISLEAHGFMVLESRLGREGLRACADSRPDMVILDLGLPDMDGVDFITRLREWSQTPVIVLSVRAEEAEKVTALDAGANDYVTKPFGISELMARIRVLLRSFGSNKEEEASLFVSGELMVDLASRTVMLADRPIKLSRKEYDLLKLLVVHAGQVLTHKQILRTVWGPLRENETHHLRVLVGHLRQKLGDPPTQPRYILTEQGVGYRLANID